MPDGHMAGDPGPLPIALFTDFDGTLIELEEA